MGVLDTTYTFTATDVVTSAKLNNVIDQTTFTATAVTGATLAVSASGQLRVNTITSNEMGGSSVNSTALADNSVITAKIADANVTTSKILDANITQAKIGANVVGKGPAFRAHATTTTAIGANAHTEVNLATEDYDTNSNFANNRFTPQVAGYYLITGAISSANSPTFFLASIIKNTTQHSFGPQVSGSSIRTNVSDIVYLNGTTDFVALHALALSAVTISTGTQSTYFSGCLIRSV